MCVLFVIIFCEFVPFVFLCVSYVSGCLGVLARLFYACVVCEALYIVAWCVVCDGVRGGV